MTHELKPVPSHDIESNDAPFLDSRYSFDNSKTSVYIIDAVNGWVPAELIEVSGGKAIVTCESHLFSLDGKFRHSEKKILSNSGYALDEETSATSSTTASSLKHFPVESTIDETNPNEISVQLKDYSGGSLPLQYVDDDGNQKIVADLRDLPFIHEANVLYNTKARYESPNQAIYTRLHHRIVIAINPNKWIGGLYAEDTRLKYAEKLVWKGKEEEGYGKGTIT